MPRFHITVHGADREAMADLVRVHDVRVLPQTLDEGGAGARVDALVDESAIQRLTDAGYRVERHEDVDEAARDDLQQVGQGNRFAADLAAAMQTKGERQ
jgi:3-dehydroquinate synthase class II